MTFRQNIHIGICNGAAMEQATWYDQRTGVRQSTKSNSKLASLEHKQTTTELASLLTRAFERMVEQSFNCFTDGLEL